MSPPLPPLAASLAALSGPYPEHVLILLLILAGAIGALLAWNALIGRAARWLASRVGKPGADSARKLRSTRAEKR